MVAVHALHGALCRGEGVGILEERLSRCSKGGRCRESSAWCTGAAASKAAALHGVGHEHKIFTPGQHMDEGRGLNVNMRQAWRLALLLGEDEPIVVFFVREQAGQRETCPLNNDIRWST